MTGLDFYEPLPWQQAFHDCDDRNLLVLKGNRAGATLAGCVEIARAVMGYGGKYPTTGGTAVIVTTDERAIGRHIYKMLFKSEAFIGNSMACRQLQSQLNTQEEKNLAQAICSTVVPPLIPVSAVKSISWRSRTNYVFDRIRFASDWELLSLTIAGDDAGKLCGTEIDLVFSDEDPLARGWHEEFSARSEFTRIGITPLARYDDALKCVAEHCSVMNVSAEWNTHKTMEWQYAGLDDEGRMRRVDGVIPGMPVNSFGNDTLDSSR